LKIDMAQRLKFTVILEPEADGGYSVHCPALAGCVSQGSSRKEALKNILEAIPLVLAVMEEKGVSIPTETPEVIVAEIREILNAREGDGLPLTIETAEVKVSLEVAV